MLIGRKWLCAFFGSAGMLLVSTMSAYAGGTPNTMQKQEHTKIPKCPDHKAPTGDCHVVDESNYQHLKMVDRSNLGAHGRREMLEYQRASRSKIKN
tara:strand:- start:276 stop:563 length:288 start_codon:yes stop_codon:yes gene_type:complete